MMTALTVASGIMAVISMVTVAVGAIFIATSSNTGRSIFISLMSLLIKFVMPIVMAVGIWVYSVSGITINTLFAMVSKLVPSIDYFNSFFSANSDGITGVKFMSVVNHYFIPMGYIGAVALFIFVLYKYMFVADQSETLAMAVGRFVMAIVMVSISFWTVSVIGHVFTDFSSVLSKGFIMPSTGAYFEKAGEYEISEEAPILTSFVKALEYYNGNYKKDKDGEYKEVEKTIQTLLDDVEAQRKAGDDNNEAGGSYKITDDGLLATDDEEIDEDFYDRLEASVKSIPDLVAMGYQIIVIVLMCTVLFCIVKLFITLLKRYIVWCVNYMLAPFMMCTIASKATAAIFWKYIQTVVVQSLVMMIGLWSTRIVFEAINNFPFDYKSMSGLIFYAALIMGLTEIPAQMEAYFQSVGLGSVQTMGSLGQTILSTMQGAQRNMSSASALGSQSTRTMFAIPNRLSNAGHQLSQTSKNMHNTAAENRSKLTNSTLGTHKGDATRNASEIVNGGTINRKLNDSDGYAYKALTESGALKTSDLSEPMESQLQKATYTAKGGSDTVRFNYKDADGNPKTGVVTSNFNEINPNLGYEAYAANDGKTWYRQMGAPGKTGKGLEAGLSYGFDTGKTDKLGSMTELNAFVRNNNLTGSNGKKFGGDMGVGASSATLIRNNQEKPIGLNLQNASNKTVGKLVTKEAAAYNYPGGEVISSNKSEVGKLFHMNPLSSVGTVDARMSVRDQQMQVMDNIRQADRGGTLGKMLEGAQITGPAKDLHNLQIQTADGKSVKIFDNIAMMDMDPKAVNNSKVTNIAGTDIHYMVGKQEGGKNQTTVLKESKHTLQNNAKKEGSTGKGNVDINDENLKSNYDTTVGKRGINERPGNIGQ